MTSDKKGNIIIVGWTTCIDFNEIATSGAWQSDFNPKGPQHTLIF